MSEDSEVGSCSSPYTLYEVQLEKLVVKFDGGFELDVSTSMANGRANYDVVQRIIALLAGLKVNSEGAKSDLVDSVGQGYEVKSFKDKECFPSKKLSGDLFHTAASSLFGANNHGPTVKALLENRRYDEALELCREHSYGKNDFYVYVNSGKYNFSVPLRFVIVPTDVVLKLVSKDDPRKIARADVLGLVQRTKSIQLARHFSLS